MSEEESKPGPAPDRDLADLPGKDPEGVAFPAPGGQLKQASELVAESLALMLKAGLAPSAIEEKAPEALEALRHDNKARKALRLKLKDFDLEAEELRSLVKGLLVEKALESEDEKIQLDAIKQIAAFPQVGLGPGAKTIVNVGVLSEASQKVMASLGEED